MLRGGCFCGRVRYETDAEPFDQTVCHCVDCRRMVGSVSVAWFTVPTTALRYVADGPQFYRSSASVARGFCDRCGTSLTYAHDAKPDEIDVTIASLDDPGAVTPADHTMIVDRVGWDEICDGRPVFRRAREEPQVP